MGKSGEAMLQVAGGALVCEGAQLEGEITIGAGTVIHPGCCILAIEGPIVIGENNIFEERVCVTNRNARREDKRVVIGNSNIFEVGCQITDCDIGDANIIEAKACLDRVQLTTGCSIGVSVVLEEQVVAAEMALHAPRNCAQHKENAAQLHSLTVTRQLELLRKVLPDSHIMVPAGTEEEEPTA